MKKIILMLVLAASVFVLAACGGDESGSESNLTPDHSIDLVASNWEFEQDTYTVPSGNVEVNLINNEGFHGIKVEGTGISIEGEGSDVAAMEPGEYTIRCTVPCGAGHTEMVATLIVE
ncbi:cytochrome C oxidase subunit II [Aquibacillus koreensis]|uniref:Cytochrome C oxidase subunit II n=1 Tax=Aquibacillus koreensis TaxID=279446 RepID=A0A9X3WK90_9BACI|nr:cytochrome C oxidase subunit II [Aquibacillus koreensis]MCT2536342.1 cytochrome C oxidase subunit II [Aquibacillus koreensis]MDC3421307.1 cytochrome C oxidase subunit II [Aquibacillus koreensis]